MKQRIIINPEICGGRPVIAGTRITVQTILEFLGAGDSIEDILAEYPSLSRNICPILAAVGQSTAIQGPLISVWSTLWFSDFLSMFMQRVQQ